MRTPLAASLLAALALAAGARGAPGATPAAPDAPRHIVLAVTSQLRGSVSSRIVAPDRSPGGLAHLAVLIRRAREADPTLVLLDAGNALTGAPDALLPAGADAAPPLLAAMNRLDYDAAVPAERDLDRSPAALAQAVEASGFPWLGANLTGAGSAIRASTLVEREGLRIGVIGLVSPGVLLGREPAFRERFRIADAEDAAGHEAARLRADARADLVIALGAGAAADEPERESGLLEDLPLPNAAGVIADRTPGLDLVISGRGRMPRKGAVARPNRSYRVPLIEPVPSSRALTLVVLDVVRDGGRWRVARVSQETQWAEESTDPGVVAATGGALEETRLRLAQRLPVYVAGRAFKRGFQACAGALGHAAALRAAAIRLNAAGTEGGTATPPLAPVATAGLSLLPTLWAPPRWTREDFGRPLTRGDVSRWIGQDDALVLAELTGRQIALLLEPYVRQMHGWRTPASQVLYPGGLDVELAPKRSEAASLRLAGSLESVQDYRPYTLWMGRYHRFGGGGLAARALIGPDQPARLVPLTLREAVLEFLADPEAPLPEACASLLSRQPPEPRTHKRRPRHARNDPAPAATEGSGSVYRTSFALGEASLTRALRAPALSRRRGPLAHCAARPRGAAVPPLLPERRWREAPEVRLPPPATP